MSGGDVPGSGREQSAVTRGSGSESAAEAIRRTLSSVTEASAQITARHFEYTRRRAGFGVGAVTTWALTNAIWRLSTPSFNATAMALSSYNDAATTVAMTAAGGLLGFTGDITTCLSKREETKDTLSKFIELIHNARAMRRVKGVTYKNYLTGTISTLSQGEDIREAWKRCVEMEIELRTGEVFKLSNVNNCGSKYMLAHVIATLTSISLFSACMGVTGVGLHDIMSKTNATATDSNTTSTAPDTTTPSISPIAASVVAALGTLPIITFINWLTTLCLQQEKQIAEASSLLWNRDMRDNKHLIDLLSKLEVLSPSELVVQSRHRGTEVRTDEPGSQDSLLAGLQPAGSNNAHSEIVDAAVPEVAFSILTSGASANQEATQTAHDSVEDTIHTAAQEVGLTEEAEASVLNLMTNMINEAEQVSQDVDYRHLSENDSQPSTGSYSAESRGSSIIQRLLDLRSNFEDGSQRLTLREGREAQSRLRSWHSAPSSFRDPESGLPDDLQDNDAQAAPSSDYTSGPKPNPGKRR